MNETLKQYVRLVKKKNEIINQPEYADQEPDIEKKMKHYERELQQGFSTDDGYDEFADAVIKCVYGDISIDELETVYHELISSL
ncbi:YnfE family protein [Bacillus changyiensis]|uniref:YnfE family protein n=1 Tax=Bacillus changyiensis TaxID=3004103 RepID=UPI0022E35B27|nr:YnfE family protein [Bacillus changyiensis]MDA1475192.1 YnfE family protein [Bacillus changyiensis]